MRLHVVSAIRFASGKLDARKLDPLGMEVYSGRHYFNFNRNTNSKPYLFYPNPNESCLSSAVPHQMVPKCPIQPSKDTSLLFNRAKLLHHSPPRREIVIR
jgi:hypothetical protein